MSKQSIYNQTYYKKYPWSRTFFKIRDRVNNKNYAHFKNYGGRGIKCLMSMEDIKSLWFRDKAYLMKKPSIDRIDNNGNYELSNCQFIEVAENTRKAQTIIDEFTNIKSSSLRKYKRKIKARSILATKYARN